MRCCAPSRLPAVPIDTPPSRQHIGRGRHPIDQVEIPAGRFAMGDAFGDGRPEDGEQPVHVVTLDAFVLDATCVTNDAFAAFVTATGYVTEAERFGFSAVFHLQVTAPDGDVLGAPTDAPWWRGVRNACWQRPGGDGSDVEGLGDHPVVHVSWNDALAYCAWSGRRLPTEAEWEYAARGGREGTRYPWGDALAPGGVHQCNIWQGDFPTRNSAADGHVGTAPVKRYARNGYGLWQMAGNVWEWCADWYAAAYYLASPRHGPPGPAFGERRVLRGGSYLCHDAYCNRYRVAARAASTPDSSAANVGFRTARDAGSMSL
jgi:sulfatase modifying factor 1